MLKLKKMTNAPARVVIDRRSAVSRVHQIDLILSSRDQKIYLSDLHLFFCTLNFTVKFVTINSSESKSSAFRHAV